MSNLINRIQGFLNESKTAEVNPKQIKAIEDWIKKKIKKQVRLVGTLKAGTFVAKVPLDGAHGELCSWYQVSGSVWDASSEQHPNTLGARFDLNWEYKSRGTNGTGLGTIFLDADGKIIQEQKPF